MIHFTKYAEEKFDVLQRHKVYLTREMVEDAVNIPERHGRLGKNNWAEKEGIKVIFKIDGEVKKILTFFPVKQINK